MGIDIGGMWGASRRGPGTVPMLAAARISLCLCSLPAAMYTIFELIVRVSAAIEPPDCCPRSTVFTISKNTSKRTMDVASAVSASPQISLTSRGPLTCATEPAAEQSADSELFLAAVKQDSQASS